MKFFTLMHPALLPVPKCNSPLHDVRMPAHPSSRVWRFAACICIYEPEKTTPANGCHGRLWLGTPRSFCRLRRHVCTG